MARFQRGSEIRDVGLESDRVTYCERQRALLAAGWRRIRDPASEADFPDDPREPTLEQAIHDNPDDDQNWLVYADHLIEHGHPRGQLVAIESAPVRNIVQRAEREAEARRLRHAASDVLGNGLVGRANLGLRWRRGFIHEAKLHGAFARGEAEDLLFDLLRHPSARFLRELAIHCWHRDAQDHRMLVDLLLHAAAPPPLRSLSIVYDTDEWHGFAPLGELGALGESYPQLENIRLEGDDTTRLAGLALPRAKRFAFNTVGMPLHTLRAIAEAPWPALEELELWIGQSTCTLDDMRFAFDLPALRRLRIIAAPFANELVHQLAGTPLAARLEALDLRHSPFDHTGTDTLIAMRARFPVNMRCFLAHTRASHDDRRRLEDAGIEVDDWWYW